MSYFVSLFFFITGVSILLNKSYKARWNTNNVDLSSHYAYIIVGLGLIIYSFSIIYATIKDSKNPNTPPPKHPICPNCKQTYNHKELKDKKCPKCKVDVIDIKKYSKDNISKENKDKKR